MFGQPNSTVIDYSKSQVDKAGITKNTEDVIQSPQELVRYTISKIASNLYKFTYDVCKELEVDYIFSVNVELNRSEMIYKLCNGRNKSIVVVNILYNDLINMCTDAERLELMFNIMVRGMIDQSYSNTNNTTEFNF